MQNITPAVLDIIEKTTIKGNTIKLPDIQLDRPIYEEVKEVFTRLRGNWVGGKTQGFVFQYDPTNLLKAVLEAKEMPAKNPLDYFPTPKSVVERVLSHARIFDGATVLEPSAGQGAIAKAAKALGADVDVCEYDAINRSSLPDFNLVGTDFLEYNTDKKYTSILMNPPFTAEGNPAAWIDHMKHAFSMLSPKGTLVCICPTNWITNKTKRYSEFRSWMDSKFVNFELVSAGEFKESGTAIETCIIVLDNIKCVREGYKTKEAHDFFMYADNDRESYDAMNNGFKKISNGENSRTVWESVRDMVVARAIKVDLMYIPSNTESVYEEYMESYENSKK